MNDVVTSIVRTLAVLAAGSLITWGVRQGVPVDASVQQPLTELLVAVFGAAYYVVARILENWHPSFGWMLGAPRQPTYPPKPPPPPAAPEPPVTGP